MSINKLEITRSSTRRRRMVVASLVSFTILVVAGIATAFLINHQSSPEPPPTEVSMAEYRLPSNLVPLWYNLSVQLYLPGYVPLPEARRLTFAATVVIKVHVRKTTRLVELNALELNLTTNLGEILVSRDGGSGFAEKIGIVEVEYKPAVSKVLLHLNNDLLAENEYRIVIPYSAPLKRCMVGLCYSFHYDAAGQPKYYAVTNSEPIAARKLVPCFDEPSYKAVWRLSVTHPVGTTAIANTMEVYTSRTGNWIRTQFDETPPMSTYLLAFAVSDFAYRETNFRSLDGKTIRFRVWSREMVHPSTEWSLTAGVKILRFYEEKFQIAFPIPKMDMLAVPDFFSGAMENWGLVTYQEWFLLYNASDPQRSFPEELTANIIAHELAHQWFGNLVTLEWWSDLFLNEGFATFVGGLGSDFAMNQSHSHEYGPDTTERMLGSYREMLPVARPIHYELRAPGDFTVIFDFVSYSKGAFVIHMLEQQMGGANFVTALRNYLRKHAFSNTNYHDLLDSLSAVTSINRSLGVGEDGKQQMLSVAEFAEGWITNAGYPVVFVHRLNSSTVELTQSHFVMASPSGENNTATSSDKRWWIPIWYSVDGVNQEMELLYESLILPVDENQLLIVNSDSLGLYRVFYDEPLRNRIVDQLAQNNSRIPEDSCCRFIDDLMHLAQAGYLGYEVALGMVTNYLVQYEDKAEPFSTFYRNLYHIASLFDTEPERQQVEDYIDWIREKSLRKTPSLAGNVLSTTSAATSHTLYSSWPSAYRNQLYTRRDHLAGLTTAVEQRILGRYYLTRLGRNHAEHSNSMYADALGHSGKQPVWDDRAAKVLQDFRELFIVPCRMYPKQMSSQCSRIPIGGRQQTYCAGVRHGTRSDFDLVKALYTREKNHYERLDLLHALTCVRDEALLKLLLRASIHDDDPFISLEFTDVNVYFSIAYANELGRKLVAAFFMAQYETIIARFSPLGLVNRCLIRNLLRYQSDLIINDLVEASFQDNSHEGIHILQHFFDEHSSTTQLYRGFADRLATLRAERSWLDRNFKQLSTWFAEQNSAHRQE